MKTENSTTRDPVWTNNVELLSQEECLPIIGSCQVSSILQTLDTTDGRHQNMDLIILPSNDLKLPIEGSFTLNSNYIIVKEECDKPLEKPKIKKLENNVKKKERENFEDMLYFVCNLCPFLCTEDTKITEHLENAHKNKTSIKLPQLKCPACPNIFYHKMSLRSHLIHDHGVGNIDLNRIVQAVAYYSNKRKNKEKENQQKIQNKMTTTVKNLEGYEKNQTNAISDDIDNSGDSENYEVPEKVDQKIVDLPKLDLLKNKTDKIFNSLQKQSESVTKYIESKKGNKCILPACNVKLQDMDKLNYHINCHTDSGFECQDCGEKFILWKPLTSHLWRVHKIDMDLFSCDKCDYKTYSLAKLNNIHKLIHSEVRGFSCNVCNKAFKNSKQLRNHKMTHKDKKLMFLCEICNKNFGAKKQLRVHMDVVHKKIRPYLCSYCGYKGSSRSALKMHIRQHTGEKPFSCNYCSYTSSDHNSLRRHKFRHTGQKPYKCSYCTYECIQSSTYKTHLKTKHPGMEKDLMFTCTECQFRSVNKDNYFSHMISVHKIKP